ncbi:MAG: VOC family protein [Acidimicrobiales bacterium]
MGVLDLSRSSAFYERLGWTRAGISTSDMVVLSTPASAVLVLHKLDDLLASARMRETPSGFGGVVLGVVVGSLEAVHTTLAKAVDAGATVLRPVTQLGYGSHAFFADPDGHVWEVIETPGLQLGEGGAVSVP